MGSMFDRSRHHPEVVLFPDAWQLGFQEPCSTSMEAIIAFHDDLMFYVIFITLFVLYMLCKTLALFRKDTTNPN